MRGLHWFALKLNQPEKSAGAFPWLWEAEYGGGILANFVAHGVNLATRLFGAVRAVDATLVTRAALASSLARQHERQMAFLAGVAHDLRNPLGALKISLAIGT